MNAVKKEVITLVLVLLAVPVALTAGCTPNSLATGKIGVAVTILPQAEFVENVGGEENVAVTVMVPARADPHTYEPIPSQIISLAQARMYVKVGSGVEFELAWMDKLIATNQDMLVVDCAKGVTLQQEEGASQDNQPHGLMDPHIWMSPPNAKIMVRNICDGLIQIDPDHRAYYQQNSDTYLQQLTQLDQDIRTALSDVTKRTFLIYHPALGYFAREYNLTMIPIEEEGKEPTPAEIVRLIEQAKAQNIQTIFASPQFNPESAKVIAGAIGGKVVFIDVLARDYLTNMRVLLGVLLTAME